MFFTKHETESPIMLAGDKTHLQELLHPGRDPVNIGYSLAKATLMPGESSLPHKLDSTEVYYFIKGFGKAYIDQNEIPVEKGSMVFIPAGTNQHVVNSGSSELVFLCIVEPFWQEANEKITS